MGPDEQMRITWELQRRLADFWHDVDTNWGRTAADFFTEDGVFEASEQTYRGREHIRQFYEYRLSRGARVAAHLVMNFRVQVISATEATSTWYLVLHAQDGVPVLPSAPPIQIALATDHSVQGEDGEWRYRNRRFESWFKGGVPTTTFRG